VKWDPTPSNLSALQGDDLNPSIFVFVHQPIRVYGIAMVDLAVYEVGLRGKVMFWGKELKENDRDDE
ncbi:hypothetical protein Tco_1222036, partial [Tanacetum coccineum]